MNDDSDRILFFGGNEKRTGENEVFGNKAAYLSKLSVMGIPVPPGFCLGVPICNEYYYGSCTLPDDLESLIRTGITFIEECTGRKFGDSKKPLLLSIRSGAAVSMPGVMDTLLNVGMNAQSLEGLILKTGNPGFAWDIYRRLLENYGVIVLGHEPALYRDLLRRTLQEEGINDECLLDFDSLRKLAKNYETLLQKKSGKPFPQNAYEQLDYCVKAVLDSWMSKKARSYREIHKLDSPGGTAVTIQSMVFGNLNSNSGAGVAFSRNPWTGNRGIVVDFKFRAQGEDVVSGYEAGTSRDELITRMGPIYQELKKTAGQLEKNFRDMQDFEFTVENGRLFILQTRPGKRAQLAALKIASDMVEEGLISIDEGLDNIRDINTSRIFVETVNSAEKPAATGDSASLGVVSGKIAFGQEKSVFFAETGKSVLVKEYASPDDIGAIAAASGILTARGARTSHAAVVARQMGKVCIVNCKELEIELSKKRCFIGGKEFHEGDTITLDGSSGHIYPGEAEFSIIRPLDLIEKVEGWKKGQQN
ncbi:MAG: hypothetical protein JW931_08965 [Methanomicrobiaceae archaeon]|nr:hypothetical protein [Methanomicrobiaceae archaeon]